MLTFIKMFPPSLMFKDKLKYHKPLFFGFPPSQLDI